MSLREQAIGLKTDAFHISALYFMGTNLGKHLYNARIFFTYITCDHILDVHLEAVLTCHFLEDAAANLAAECICPYALIALNSPVIHELFTVTTELPR